MTTEFLVNSIDAFLLRLVISNRQPSNNSSGMSRTSNLVVGFEVDGNGPVLTNQRQ